MKRKSFDSLEGNSAEEKISSLGINPGKKVNILDLMRISQEYRVEAALYFEEDIARKSGYEQDLSDFADVPVFERPFVEVREFIRFGKENDPSFASRLETFPLVVTIISTGTRKAQNGRDIPYITALMPFLDEIDFDGDSLPGQ